MNFLQPAMLWAVPLIALPIVIHLINQRRYQTMPWGAMRFLMMANRMSRGYARIRQWLILAARTLAIAGLVLAASRPLASGIMGLLSGSRADTTIILLDRSPSMQQTGAGGGASKLKASLGRLFSLLETLPSDHWVLIDSAASAPQPVESLAQLRRLPTLSPSSQSADLPAMLRQAAEYIRANQTGRTDIWICSDLRRHDWRPDSGDWDELRNVFRGFPQGVQFRLSAWDTPAPDNLSVRVTETQRVTDAAGTALLLSLEVTRAEASKEPLTVPLQIDVGDARAQAELSLVGRRAELRQHRIPLDSTVEQGWGKVSLPADTNQADDEYYFSFAKPAARNTVLVSDDPDAGTAWRLAAEVPARADIECVASVVSPQQLDSVDWSQTAMLIWAAPLPAEQHAGRIDQFVARGGQVLFVPPAAPDSQRHYQNVRWQGWESAEPVKRVTSWRMDQDLLANAASGMPLPLGELQMPRVCPPVGELTSLATLNGGQPLFSRLPTSSGGGVYFCSTTARPADSSLADNGAVLYVAVQRALAAGAAVLQDAQQAMAGQPGLQRQLQQAQQLAGDEESISTDYHSHAGVYQADERLVAVNRTRDEDLPDTLSAEEIREQFAGLDFTMVQAKLSEQSDWVNEIWRLFLIMMIAALLLEAVLCTPRAASARPQSSFLDERQRRQEVVAEMQVVGEATSPP